MNPILRILSTFLLLPITCLAQFSAIGGKIGTPFDYTSLTGTGLEHIFVLSDETDARLSFADDDPSSWTWYTYTTDPATATAVELSKVNVTATETTVNSPSLDNGYFVRSAGGNVHYCYLISWIPVSYSAVTVIGGDDPCSEISVHVTANGGSMIAYSTSGVPVSLVRTNTLEWTTSTWNETTESYDATSKSTTFSKLNSNITIDAPLSDTYFTVTGDQFSGWFGLQESVQSALYQAVAVKQNATYEVVAHTAENEKDGSTGDLTGSAPLEVTFYSHPSEAVELVEWFVYKPESTEQYARYTDQDLNYTFKESGTYTVKLVVSNSVCRDTVLFNPVLSVSMLDCPNYFSPRSSPGENDEFRVAYRSLISFKGVIVDRWGVVMFQWTDPAKGWNGTYKGKAVKPGVYFYTVQAVGSDGIHYSKKGDINLLE